MASHGNTSAPPRVVLSGGIGSGKSTVAELLARRGWRVVAADRLGHEVLEPGGEAHAEVARRWPSVVVDGRIDRARLARIVFADPDALAELEALTHPAIGRRIRRLVAEAGDVPVVVEVPVLAPELVDPTWTRVYVDAPEELRLARAVARGGDPDDVRRRMAAQPSASEWRRWADLVIENRGSLDDLEASVDELVAELGHAR
ncbi:MAG TPA: dephospho-CoA kinase [Actinobacteria bacterium]|nr:dephospho-CoA kinase [Actinomycetota bacterium]